MLFVLIIFCLYKSKSIFCVARKAFVIVYPERFIILDHVSYGSMHRVLLVNLPENSRKQLSHRRFFQWAFCVTAATIVSGGVAERLQLGGYIIFTTWMTGVIYPTVGS